MFRFVRAHAAAAIAAGALLSAPLMAHAAPDATISFHGGSVAFIAGVNWGSGKLHFGGKTLKLKVSGLSVGAIGASSYDADGEVFNLHHADDIEGTYAAVDASATAGGGEGVLDMKNEHGVEIRAHATSAGLKLALGPSGVVVKLDH
jgi:hypothetical protein